MAVLFFPERKVFLEEFDDGLSVSEVFFRDVIDLVQCLLQSYLRQFACLLLVLHHLVVENRIIQSQTQSDGVARRQSDLVCLLVCLQGFILDGLELRILSCLSYVPVIIAYHLNEERFRFILALLAKNLTPHDFDDLLAVCIEGSFDLGLVGF